MVYVIRSVQKPKAIAFVCINQKKQRHRLNRIYSVIMAQTHTVKGRRQYETQNAEYFYPL